MNNIGLAHLVEDVNENNCTTLKIESRISLREGLDYFIINKKDENVIPITVTSYSQNILQIDQQVINAVKGSVIVRDPASIEAELMDIESKLSK